MIAYVVAPNLDDISMATFWLCIAVFFQIWMIAYVVAPNLDTNYSFLPSLDDSDFIYVGDCTVTPNTVKHSLPDSLFNLPHLDDFYYQTVFYQSDSYCEVKM